MAFVAKTVVTTTRETDDPPEETKESELEPDVLRALVELDNSGEVTWKITRLTGKDGERGFCGSMSSAELSQDAIAEKYGPGKYQIRGIKANGAYFKSNQIEISRSAGQPMQQTELLAALSSRDDPMKFLSLMMQMQQTSQQQMMQVQQASQNQMTQVLTAMIAKPDQKGFPTEALLGAAPAMLVALKEFFVSGKTDPMKQMLDAITITEKLRGKEGDKETGSTWIDLVRDGLQSVPALLTRSSGQASTVAPQSVLPGATSALHTPTAIPETVDTPEAVPAPEGSEMYNFKMLQEFKQKLTWLIEKAKKNGNTELYAEVFLEELPDSITEENVLAVLSRDDWFALLKGLDTRVETYRGWFESLREELFLILQPDGAPDDERTESHTTSTRGTREITTTETVGDSDSESTDAG